MQNKPNVVLIVVDALRADHLACYGYERATSPEIDAIARQGVLSERMFCSALPTQPSFTTVYSGQHPMTHGIISHGGTAKLARETPVLAEVFLRSGYKTCAVDNLMRERSWFGRGFEYYIDPSLRRILCLGVTAEEINAYAIPWLESHSAKPFFLMLHYWDTHVPYAPPRKYRSLFYEGNPTDPDNRSLDAFWKHPFGVLARETWLHTPDGLITDAAYATAMYDQEIRHVSEGIGELVGTIDRLGLSDDTLVLVISDHGESMTEHGIFYEHHGLYDATLHIPAIMRWPGRVPAGRRLPHMLQHQDLAPTLLEAAGIPVPRTMDGQSFWKLATGESEAGGRDRAISVESTLQAKWSLRTDRYKFILAREPDIYGTPPRELYDLAADPGEEHNIADRQSATAAELEQELEAWIGARTRALGRREDPVREQGISLKAVLSEYRTATA